jgi:alpha-galactosidase
MTKITFLGAGSTEFAQDLLGDLLGYPELAESTYCLYDIDPARLRTTEIVAHKIAETLGAHPAVQATLDRRAALDGSDYAIAMYNIGGYKPATLVDFEIPKKYGLRQTIGDTLGIGGIMRGLRTIPIMLDMLRDMEELCPDVLHLNYVNPMAINVWAACLESPVHTIGLCHSVQNTAEELARDIGVPLEEINYLCAGINHMAFYLRFERRGPGGIEDLYPRIRQVSEEGRVPPGNRVRYEIFKRLGYFVTESSEHFSEYVPWFIKRDRPDLIDRFNIPLDEYLRRLERQASGWQALRAHVEAPGSRLGVKPTNEYAPVIIHSLENGKPGVVYANVPNQGLIENLPPDCVVEVPCLVDRNGVQPVQVGRIPPQLAALMQTNINVQALTVEAALSGDRDHIYHAAMLDPHTSAELDLDQIHALVDDLLDAHGAWLPHFS